MINPSTRSDLLPFLDNRAREIFKQIVANYLEEAKPIGSQNLSRLLPNSLSPATIRKVMSDLENLGLITAPHTSAGRLPTQNGLRLFIDSFLEVNELSAEEKIHLKKEISLCDQNRSVEDFLKDTSQILSDISQSAGVVATTKQDLTLKQIEFVRLDAERAMAILIAQNGEIENRILSLPKTIDDGQLIEASNYLNRHISGRTLEQACLQIARAKEATHSALHKLAQDLVDRGVALFAGQSSDKKMRLIIHGHSNLLSNIKVEEDLKRVKQLFSDLEEQEKISELLQLTNEGSGVRVFIGAENKLFSLSESALIVAPYQNGEQKIIGAVGVIGPTHLNYARIVPIVNYTAQLITQLIE